ncbi:YkvA family protein [Salimicrobium halophilum]|uniref:Uncharacterized membrane protein YkvA, DUF1232 family n=1 Tax=Salimicrobium halophilum TaxID=86666 RepID=A0A1G8S4A6_9BACI|nr:YkvA family protein [Salimicrobium halophilum]SDJ23982.1 Uncharacterized membrane protein YkvA, DUF1232 family [Salimicrobium halophilum]
MKRKFDPKKLYTDFMEKNRSTVKEYMSNPKKMKELFQLADEKAEKNEGYLQGAVGKVKLLASLLRAYKRGEYRDVSNKTIIMVVVTLLYFVTPVDAWPDFLPLGYVDDLALLGYTMRTINDDLMAFRDWKEKNEGDAEDPEIIQ